jgi:hypothetical protein
VLCCVRRCVVLCCGLTLSAATFSSLKKEHEEERGRLRAEHARLHAMQSELSAESGLLRDQLISERERSLTVTLCTFHTAIHCCFVLM